MANFDLEYFAELQQNQFSNQTMMPSRNHQPWHLHPNLRMRIQSPTVRSSITTRVNLPMIAPSEQRTSSPQLSAIGLLRSHRYPTQVLPGLQPQCNINSFSLRNETLSLLHSHNNKSPTQLGDYATRAIGFSHVLESAQKKKKKNLLLQNLIVKPTGTTIGGHSSGSGIGSRSSRKHEGTIVSSDISDRDV